MIARIIDGIRKSLELAMMGDRDRHLLTSRDVADLENRLRFLTAQSTIP